MEAPQFATIVVELNLLSKSRLGVDLGLVVSEASKS